MADDAAGQRTLVLDETLDLTSTVELAKSLTALRGADLRVDASAVRRVGAQCLQILVSAAASWKADRAVFRVVEGSPDFIEGVRLLGLQSAFPLEDPCR